MELHIGDKVYIRPGALDIRTGRHMPYGGVFTEQSGTPCTIALIDMFYTEGKYHLPPEVERIKCVNNRNETVWEVRRQDISDNIIYADIPPQTKANPLPPQLEPTVRGKERFNISSEEYHRMLENSSTYTRGKEGTTNTSVPATYTCENQPLSNYTQIIQSSSLDGDNVVRYREVSGPWK